MSTSTKDQNGQFTSGCNLFFNTTLLLISLSITGFGFRGFLESYSALIPGPFFFGVAPVSFSVDFLSGVFLLLLGVIGISVACYLPGYLKQYTRFINPVFFYINLLLFMCSMGCVLASENVLTLLVFWEIMSLSSTLLMASNPITKSAKKAILIYLGSTRIATAFLSLGLIGFGILFKSWNFSDWDTGAYDALIPSVLVLIGLSIKAGLWPFHLWLPYAHPAAPSPVSALMSGVMIKTAIYLMIRIFVVGNGIAEILAVVLLVLGVITAIWGILFALVQNDLKRMLAYSSVENIGLIIVGIATALYLKSGNLSQLSNLALIATLFHCFNHGIFKSALFLCSGSIDSNVHSQDLSRFGAFGRKMPFTMFAFIIAGMSICALPPLNGFASKWLIYQSLFLTCFYENSNLIRVLIMFSIGSLALVSGLSIVCFTKAIAFTFLGRARSNLIDHISEVSKAMIFAQISLAVICILLGVFANNVYLFLSRLLPVTEVRGVPLNLNVSFVPLIASVVLLVWCLFSYGRKYKLAESWECGFGPLSRKMQISPSSFSQPIASIFQPVLLYRLKSEISGIDRKHFPEKVKSESLMTSLLESRIYGPIVDLVISSGNHIAKLQAGSIHMYLLYMLISLILLLVAGTLI